MHVSSNFAGENIFMEKVMKSSKSVIIFIKNDQCM